MAQKQTVAPRVAALALLLALFLVAAQREENRAGLVIAFGDGRVETFCIPFAGETIGGQELLRRSGLEVEANVVSQGAAVCRIEEIGCPAGNCFCRCRGEPCEYWSYWRLEETGWEYAVVGAAARQLQPGDVDGWTWGPGSVTDAPQPPSLTFADICAADTGTEEAANALVVEMSPPAATAPDGGASDAPQAIEQEESAESAEREAPAWLLYGFMAVLVVMLVAALLVLPRRGEA